MPRTMNAKEQRACWSLFTRDYSPAYENNKQLVRRYKVFRRQMYYSTLLGCWVLPNWHGMLIGIEADGYTHA